MPVRVVYSPQYRSVRQSLSRAARSALDLAEDEIVKDVSDEVIEFQRVIDLRADS